MTTSAPPIAEAASAVEAEPGLLARALRIFFRPTRAWVGLERRAQWWFPVLLVGVLTSATMLLVYDRSYLPMMTEGIERQVADGQMSQQQYEHAVAFFSGPAGRMINVGFQIVGVAVITLLTGAAVWLGGFFILGREKFRYRLALEVAAWSGLITLPGFWLNNLIAYLQGVTVRDVHVGFGILVPDPETPTRSVAVLRAFLDGIGPLALWYLAVAILGLSALSGAPRRSSAVVMTGIYLVLVALLSALQGLGVRGG